MTDLLDLMPAPRGPFGIGPRYRIVDAALRDFILQKNARRGYHSVNFTSATCPGKSLSAEECNAWLAGLDAATPEDL